MLHKSDVQLIIYNQSGLVEHACIYINPEQLSEYFKKSIMNSSIFRPYGFIILLKPKYLRTRI